VRNGDVSFWLWSTGEPRQRRPALSGDRTVDVCIVGAGYTGLWTAYYLKRADPSLDVAILEREFAGFGASGRNGGWLSGLFPGSREQLARAHGREAVTRMQHALNETVDEVITVASAENIDAQIVKGGTLRVAVTPAQVARLRESVATDLAFGVGDVKLLSRDELRERIDVPAATIAAYSPHCARIHPAVLVRGLAEAVERLDVAIFEGTAVTALQPREAVSDAGLVKARAVIRATEGFTAGLSDEGRTWLPMNSSMIVTEPLPDEIWSSIGWNGCETLGDSAHVYTYSQRTADGRVAIGGRGIPYRFRSATDDRGRTHDSTVELLRQALHRMLPQTRGCRIEHAWCGVLAVPRDWCAGVTFDPTTGLGWAGGYVGHGVGPSNLAGRTLADLVLGRSTELTRMPWVGHRSRSWEPEPFRWLGVRGLYKAYGWADGLETRGGEHTSALAALADRVTGKP
jgi:glycine/D-amino acid oxidase-like deaminating enzyme